MPPGKNALLRSVVRDKTTDRLGATVKSNTKSGHAAMHRLPVAIAPRLLALALLAATHPATSAEVATAGATPTASPSGASPDATANHPGKAIYERACAICHANPEATRSPSFDTLRAMRYQTINYAL